MPLLGAYVADSYLGRYKTILYALGLDILGHSVLVMSAIPPVITNKGGSVAALILGKTNSDPDPITVRTQ